MSIAEGNLFSLADRKAVIASYSDVSGLPMLKSIRNLKRLADIWDNLLTCLLNIGNRSVPCCLDICGKYL